MRDSRSNAHTETALQLTAERQWLFEFGDDVDLGRRLRLPRGNFPGDRDGAARSHGESLSRTFGTVLRRLRKAANLSQEALAERASVSAAAIGAYERGLRSAPHRDSVRLLADALGLSGEMRREFEFAARRKVRVPSANGAESSASPTSQSLPREQTTFVGREIEIAEISGLLSRQRVVTLTGTGGVGKTRVALQVAARQKRPDGVFFVDLASVRDPMRVIAKILSVMPYSSLGVIETADTLARFLRDRRILLILDNCEHVTELTGAVVSAIVRGAPAVDVLVTSRHRLQIASEHVFRLAPLPSPEFPVSSAEQARQYAAIELFVTRAIAAERRFVFTDDEVETVVEICRQIEGIPLAIELAAARVPTLGLAVLKERLRDRLGPLKTNVRDAPERQQTLRATITWSYELLESPERLLLQRLAAFSGGCVLDAAEDVCSDEVLAPEQILDSLSALLDRSLIACDVDSRVPRYHVLESTRQFALETLAQSERHRIARRHAGWCASFAHELWLTMHELTHAEWSLIVLPDFDNIYQAIDWSRTYDRPLFSRIVGSLYFFWSRIGRPEEGRQLAADALANFDEDADPATAGRLYLARCVSLSSHKKIAAAKRAVELFERLDEPRGLGEAYIHLGGGYLMAGNREALDAVVRRVEIVIHRSGENQLLPLVSWLRAGAHALAGNLVQAREELLLALEVPAVSETEAGYELGHQLADVEYALGNIDRAADISQQLVTAARQRRMAHNEMYSLVKTAGFHILRGDIGRADSAAREALLAARGLSSTILTSAIGLLATIAALRGDAVRAARLLGYVDAWFAREEHNYVALPAACRKILVDAIEAGLEPDERARHIAIGALLQDGPAATEALLLA